MCRSPDAGAFDDAPMEPVPAVDAGTATGVRRALLIGLCVLGAAVIVVLLLTTLPRGEAAAPLESSTPTMSPPPTVSVPDVDDGTVSELEPPDETELDLEPTPEPEPEPEPEPTPTP